MRTSGTNTVEIAEGVRAEFERINRGAWGALTASRDSANSRTLEIHAVQTLMIVSSWHRDYFCSAQFRSTLIVAPIPLSVSAPSRCSTSAPDAHQTSAGWR